MSASERKIASKGVTGVCLCTCVKSCLLNCCVCARATVDLRHSLTVCLCLFLTSAAKTLDCFLDFVYSPFLPCSLKGKKIKNTQTKIKFSWKLNRERGYS